VIAITSNESTGPMVLATVPCWVLPTSPEKNQQKYFSRKGTFNGIFNWKGFVNTFKKDGSHFRNFVKQRVSLLMSALTMYFKNITSTIFSQNEKPENQQPLFFKGDHENFSKVNTQPAVLMPACIRFGTRLHTLQQRIYP
jgi:hypothetical protein